MRSLDIAKVAILLFLTAIVQTSILDGWRPLGGTPDLLLVTLVAVALLRGTLVGAVGGFVAGVVVDTATLGTLGFTSLLLTVAGYWIGRYGETTGRDRAHAPYLSVAVVTLLVGIGQLLLHFMLGEHAPAGAQLRALMPEILFNLLLAAPVYALCTRLLRSVELERAGEVRLLG